MIHLPTTPHAWSIVCANVDSKNVIGQQLGTSIGGMFGSAPAVPLGERIFHTIARAKADVGCAHQSQGVFFRLRSYLSCVVFLNVCGQKWDRHLAIGLLAAWDCR